MLLSRCFVAARVAAAAAARRGRQRASVRLGNERLRVSTGAGTGRAGAGASGGWGGNAGRRSTSTTSSVALPSSSSGVPPRGSRRRGELEWAKHLSAFEYYVLRGKGTERAGSGEYDKEYPADGHFACRACGSPLYDARSKFDSGCGWPAFDSVYEGAVCVRARSLRPSCRISQPLYSGRTRENRVATFV
jgi:hypothetical protein